MTEKLKRIERSSSNRRRLAALIEEATADCHNEPGAEWIEAYRHRAGGA